MASNEAEFRAVNETLPAPTREHVRFFCECGDRDCFDSVLLTPSEYEGVRSDPMHFVVLAGHEQLDAESVVGETAKGARIVRKHEEVRHVVDEGHPAPP